jgi:hypothetical protein
MIFKFCICVEIDRTHINSFTQSANYFVLELLFIYLLLNGKVCDYHIYLMKQLGCYVILRSQNDDQIPLKIQVMLIII